MAPNSKDDVITSPNEYLQIPEWINEEYFTPILEKYVQNFKDILKFTTVAATAPGENYTSIMVRVIIEVLLTGTPRNDGSTKQLSYILKTALDSENKGAEFVKTMNLFPKEMKMYSHYLPKFEELYKDAGLHVELAPKCLVSEELPERSTLVLEDLSLHNFKNMDRLKGFDLKYARLVVEKLAELHAASAVYEEIYGPYEAVFHHSFMNETNKPMYAAMYEPRTAGFKKSMLEWGLPDVEKYLEKMLDFETYFAENMRINTPDPLGFNVLNHGDMWTNNIMFSHNSSGQVEKTLFIDFQICKWGSPVQDLWYFIATSMQVDIRAQEFDNIIAIYHKRLVECLKVLKFSKRIPSLKDLQIKMLQNSYWAQFTAIGVTGIILYPNDKDANMANMVKIGPEGDAFRHKVFTTPHYVKSMLQWYPFIYNKGAFDVEHKHV